MRRLATSLVLAVAFVTTAFSLTVHGGDDDGLDKQYVARRNSADARVAGGFLTGAMILTRSVTRQPG